jgi:hypothetical protein
MQAEPQAEHQWLTQMVGEWAGEFTCNMGPDQPPMKSTSVEMVRSLGGLWTVAEADGTMPDGGTMKSLMTLGYDPTQQRFVGTFVASMMTHMWVYNGTLDAAKKVLTLDTIGPNFSGDGMVKYQDILEIIDADHRTLKSQLIGPDGKWMQFMSGTYTRKR